MGVELGNLSKYGVYQPYLIHLPIPLKEGKSQTATPQLQDQLPHSLITTASLKSINFLISGEDVLALDYWAQLPHTLSTPSLDP